MPIVKKNFLWLEIKIRWLVWLSGRICLMVYYALITYKRQLQKATEHTGGLIRGSFPVIREKRTETQPYNSITKKGILNKGFLVSVMIAAISKTCLNDAFSPVSRYLSPGRPLFIAAICPSTTSLTWLKENLSLPGPIYPGNRPLKRSIIWQKKII